MKKKDLDKDRLIYELLEKVNQLTKQLAELETEVSFLKSENLQLRERLNRNSGNSNQPPSFDGYKKHPALPKAEKGKQGGQAGHKGRSLQQIESPDFIIECKPEQCSCGHIFVNGDFELAEKRQVFDLPQPKLEITEYQIHKAGCPKCGLVHRGIAPDGVNGPTQYGNKVKAYAVLLNVHYKLPFKKIQLLFKDLYGYSLNESTVVSATEQCYDKLFQSEAIIKSKIAESNVAHADETGMRVSGKLHWLHTATTLMYTYLFVHEKRGKLALESDKSILDKIKGWLVHDCWGSYFNFMNLKHALCGAHILRELEGLIENENSKWAKVFKSFLMHIYKMPFEERIKHKGIIEKRYMHICRISEKSEPQPIKKCEGKGRYKRTKGRNLVERLMRQQDAVLAFAFNQEVPFTNNLAERDIRPAKVKLKISNCFRTSKGADIYARVEGFVSTARKQNQNIFSELCTTFEGHNFITG